MGVAARNVVFLADGQDRVYRVGDHRMVVLSGVSKLLAQVALSDQHYADARNLFQDGWQILDSLNIFALDDDEDFAFRSQWPNVGLGVVFLLAQAPVPRRANGSVSPNPWRIVIFLLRHARISAGSNGVPCLLHGANVGKDDAIDAYVQHLLRDPLVHLAAVGRDTHHRSDRRSKRTAVQNLPPAQQVLESVSEGHSVEGAMLHLEHDAVVVRATQRGRRLRVGRAESREGSCAFLKSPDYAVKTGRICHDRSFDKRIFATRNAGDSNRQSAGRTTHHASDILRPLNQIA